MVLALRPKSGSKPSAKKAAPKSPTKKALVDMFAEATEVSKADAARTFEAFEALIVATLKKHRAFVLPGMFKLSVVDQPAKPARPGRTPATGETMMFKAKPAEKKKTEEDKGSE